MSKPIKIEILGDDRSIRKAFGNVDAGIGGLLKPLAGMGAAIAGAFAVDRLAGFGAGIFSLARDITDITQKVSTVFEDQADEVVAWADSLNESFGVTGTQVQLMAANIADLLKPMGATTKQATQMSQEMVELAPALAEWSGGVYDAAQVSEILAKAMLGEREQLKSLGISINQAEVDTRALTIAKKEGREEFSEMDKAIATQQLIFEKSTDAQKGYITGTDTLAGQQNLLKARFAEVKEALARGLTPAFLAVGDFLANRLVPVIQTRVVPAVRDMGPPLRELAERWVPRLRDMVERLTVWFREEFAPTVERIAARVLPVLRRVGGDALTVFREWAKWLNDHREAFIGFGVILAAMFTAWAVSAAAAAVATLAAAAPVIALGVAIGALAVLIRKAYNENEGFRNGVDAVARWVRERLWPALKDLGSWIRDTLLPVIGDIAVKIGEWTIKFVDAAITAGSYLDDIVGAVGRAVGKVADFGSAWWDAITTPWRESFKWINEQWRGLMRTLGIDDGLGTGGRSFGDGGSGGRTFGTPTAAPRGARAMGGLATRTGVYDVGERGRERVILPQGARVQPAHAMAGGGDTINIYGSNLTAGDVAREIAWRRRIGSGR